MNLIQYVEQEGRYSFQERPFNEVDSVIFSLFSYLPLNGLVGDSRKNGTTLTMVADGLSKRVIAKQVLLRTWFSRKIFKLLMVMKETCRYRDVLLYHYIQVINLDVQFAAISMLVPDGSVYISYEGTDTSISGWKEDACMAYQFPIPGHLLALQYLKESVFIWDRKVRIGGHSKGGNLALYTAYQAPFYLQYKIVSVYNLDGPGFFKDYMLSNKYRKIAKKVHKIVPNESIVGMFHYHQEKIKVVQSNAKRILQHDPFNWQIEGYAFKRTNLSEYSQKVSKKVSHWLDVVDMEDRQKCVEELFQLLDDMEVTDTHDFFSLGKSIRVIKHMKDIDQDSKKNLLEALKSLV